MIVSIAEYLINQIAPQILTQHAGYTLLLPRCHPNLDQTLGHSNMVHSATRPRYTAQRADGFNGKTLDGFTLNLPLKTGHPQAGTVRFFVGQSIACDGVEPQCPQCSVIAIFAEQDIAIRRGRRMPWKLDEPVVPGLFVG